MAETEVKDVAVTLAPRIRLRAKDIMTAPVTTVRPDTPIKDLAALMLLHHVSGLPVLNAGGDLVGIVTEGDLVEKEGETKVREPGLLIRLLWRLPAYGKMIAHVRKLRGRTAGELMSTPVVTVDEDAMVHEVAQLMVRKQINRVPVVRDGRVVGIVSRADILGVFRRSDQELAAAVQEALLQELWMDVSQLHIEVHDGVVSLDGEVDRRSDKELAERWVATIDGVVKVDSRLTYRFEDHLRNWD